MNHTEMYYKIIICHAYNFTIGKDNNKLAN